MVQAFVNIQDQYIYWPDAEEQEQIAAYFYSTYGIPNIILLLDGTHFFLAYEPEVDGYAYINARKGRPSLNNLIWYEEVRYRYKFTIGITFANSHHEAN